MAKDKEGHLKTVTVMEYLLEEVKKDCAKDRWYYDGAPRQPVLDRLTEIRRLAMKLKKKIQGEY